MRDLYKIFKPLIPYLQWLEDNLENVFPRPAYDTDPTTLPMNIPETPAINPIVTPDPDALLPWTSPENNRHNVRAIADLEGLTIPQKNLMSQVIHCESGYLTTAKHPNLSDGGKVASTDFGICQWNDYYHGSEITSEEAIDNPEMAVRLMCEYVKSGRINQWVCYSSGLYKHYSA